MTSRSKPASPKPDLVVFGLGEDGKPRGARFKATEAATIETVVSSLGLTMREVDNDELRASAATLPAGRVYARGKAFIPNIKRDLLEKLRTAASSNASVLLSPPPLEDPAKTTSPGASSALALQTTLPASWEAITSGHLVLVQEDEGSEGWYEAIVISRRDDVLTCRYRDYPKFPPFEERITAVAMIHPSAD